MFEGGCTCGRVRYRLASRPMFIHGCHCTWCQRETGGALAINAIIETSRVEILSEAPVAVRVPSESGAGQVIHRCPDCQVALWSVYAVSAGDRVLFVRVGTLDDASALPPDIHIFTRSAQPWMQFPADRPAVPKYYRWDDLWPAESLARYEAALGEKA